MPVSVVRKDDKQFGWNYEVEDHSLDVEKLCVNRAELLRKEGIKVETFVTGESQGRILLFKALVSLCDGAACLSSQGFFDYSNAPPWDTWIAYSPAVEADTSDMLFSWVPDDFVQLADEGISVNPEGCLQWVMANELLEPL
jgi:hypothetical protein